MKKKIVSGLLVVLVMSTIITGCGSSNKYASDTAESGSYYAASDDFYMNSSSKYEEAVETDYAEYDMEMSEAGTGADAEIISESPTDSRKLIKNVSAEVETEQFDDFMAQIEKKTKDFGGYIESNNTYNGRSYYNSDLKNASLTIRIPATRLDDFMSTVADETNVINKNETVTDVTLQYVDLETHKKTLLAEQKRLLEMMDQAETIEDMITIESRLSDVSYQLESQEEQLRAFDNQINYSTIYLNVSEVKKYTPAAERTFWQEISEGFSDNLVSVINGIVDFIIWLITSIPYLIVWGLIIFAIVKFVCKKIADRRERKERGIDRKTQKAERKALKKQKKEAKKNAKKDLKDAESATTESDAE